MFLPSPVARALIWPKIEDDGGHPVCRVHSIEASAPACFPMRIRLLHSIQGNLRQQGWAPSKSGECHTASSTFGLAFRQFFLLGRKVSLTLFMLPPWRFACRFVSGKCPKLCFSRTFQGETVFRTCATLCYVLESGASYDHVANISQRVAGGWFAAFSKSVKCHFVIAIAISLMLG